MPVYLYGIPGHSSAVSGDMEQDLQHIYNDYNALEEMVPVLMLNCNFNFLQEDLCLPVLR